MKRPSVSNRSLQSGGGARRQRTSPHLLISSSPHLLVSSPPRRHLPRTVLFPTTERNPAADKGRGKEGRREGGKEGRRGGGEEGRRIGRCLHRSGSAPLTAGS
ncbi:hypothetical protein EYF80_055406 [Liparis tanakae]|uniref:Uncharacterized protein n=1 Tax=Liparis tanakae TaxID=230148 RepID=A0A4Z2F0F1_9TELE|nr:hypothetical protein EYF80_055406 [Liparis tanakae]